MSLLKNVESLFKFLRQNQNDGMHMSLQITHHFHIVFFCRHLRLTLVYFRYQFTNHHDGYAVLDEEFCT